MLPFVEVRETGKPPPWDCLSLLVVDRLEQSDIGEILGSTGGPLQLQQIVPVSNRDRQVTHRNPVGPGLEFGERPKMSRQGENIDPAVRSHKVPLSKAADGVSLDG